MSKYRDLLKKYLDESGVKQINAVAGLRLVSFADWLDLHAVEHSMQPSNGDGDEYPKYEICPTCKVHIMLWSAKGLWLEVPDDPHEYGKPHTCSIPIPPRHSVGG